MGNDEELLHQTIRALEKMELMHTDPRAEGFRWMITVQWNILAIALAECYVCTNQALVRRAWTLVESLYHRHESVITRHSGGHLQGPLGRLMRRTREKLASTMHGKSTLNHTNHNHKIPAQASSIGTPTSISGGLNSQTYSITKAATQSEGLSMMPGDTRDAMTPQLQQPITSAPISGFSPEDESWDQSWKMWEAFICDFPFDELDSPETIS
jgi:hypothetical protein